MLRLDVVRQVGSLAPSTPRTRPPSDSAHPSGPASNERNVASQTCCSLLTAYEGMRNAAFACWRRCLVAGNDIVEMVMPGS